MSKSFGNSPALNFINTPGAQQNTQEPEQNGKGKKLRTVTIPEGMTINPELFIEKRTKRVQLVLRPSTFEKAKAKADRLGISLNEYVHALIDTDISEE